jgi:hypothetical protein
MSLCVHYATQRPDATDALLTYLFRLNKELQTTGIKQILDTNRGLVLNSSVAATWIRENAALIAQTLA